MHFYIRECKTQISKAKEWYRRKPEKEIAEGQQQRPGMTQKGLQASKKRNNTGGGNEKSKPIQPVLKLV